MPHRPSSSLMISVLLCALPMAVSPAESVAGQADASKTTQTVAQTIASAPRAQRVVKLVGIDKSKTILYALDDDPNAGRPLNGVTLVSSGSLLVTVPALNPFETEVIATVTAADDASFTSIAKLIEVLGAIPGVVRPGGSADVDVRAAPFGGVGGKPLGENCTAPKTAQDTVNRLNQYLYADLTGASRIKSQLDSWKDEVNRSPGPTGLRAALKLVGDYAASIQANASEAAKLIAQIERLANEATPTTALEDARANLKKREDERAVLQPQAGAKAGMVNAANAKLSVLEAVIASATEAVQKAQNDVDCLERARLIYQLARLSTPDDRLATIRQLASAVTTLGKSIELAYLGEGAQWNRGTDFVVALNVTPTREKFQTVAIKQTKVSFEVADDVLKVSRAEVGSATFEVRKFSKFVPEIGAGVTFGFISRPRYGTSKNEKQETIVARLKDEDISYQPTVMLNFLPWGDGGGAAPMVQIGAAASTSAPAIFFGPGWRLPGNNGGFAIGTGVLIGWVKRLENLSENDVVKGTKDIEDDFKFDPTPKFRFYVNLQYKF